MFIILVALIPLAGCGCLEKYTDPRFDDGPLISADGKSMHPRSPAPEFPDPEQPKLQRCIFGTRWLPVNPVARGLGEPDPDQPTWHRRLFGPRYVPRWTGWDNEGPPPQK
ncbi:MAG: hypothetical protein HY289_09100 [Planctomycetes bacterium]|nr:hypothetical protein [Planctomycetota bacterium]